MCTKVYKSVQSVKKLSSGSETLHNALCNKNMRIPHLKQNLGPPLRPALCYFWADKEGGIFKIHPRVQKLCMRPYVTKI